MQRIVVLGAGFAGLWAAIGAARKLDELGIGPDRVEVTFVDRSAFHSIRVRNYEAELGDTRVPLDDILRPIGVTRVEAEVTEIDFANRRVLFSEAEPRLMIGWSLRLAAGWCARRSPVSRNTPSMSIPTTLGSG